MEASWELFDFFFDLVGYFNAFDKALEGFLGLVWEGLFATSQEDFCLYFIALAKELLCLTLFEEEIMCISTESDANAFGLNFLLLGLGLLDLLGLLVLELSVLEDAADRRLGLWGYLNQIHLLFFRDSECFGYIYLSVINIVGINQKHARNTNLFVNAQSRDNFNFGPWPAKSSTSDMREIKAKNAKCKAQNMGRVLHFSLCVLVWS